jgi:rhodanese-related sulfurtransferase
VIFKRNIRSKKYILFFAIGILIGLSGGLLVQVIYCSYKISEYEQNINYLKSEIENLNSTAFILYGNVTVKQAKDLIGVVKSLLILDVRDPSEFEESHIEGAMNIPINSLVQRIGELNREDEILVYCKLGACSSKALTILNSNNFLKVCSIIGGIEAWKQAGYPVVP